MFANYQWKKIMRFFFLHITVFGFVYIITAFPFSSKVSFSILPGNWSFAEVATDKRCRISGCFALLSPGKTRGPIGLCCWGCPMRSKRLFWGCSGFLGGGGGGGCWAASRFCWFCCCCNCCCTVGCLCVMEGLATAPLEVSETKK